MTKNKPRRLTRVGIVSEGDGEVRSLHHLYGQLGGLGEIQLLRPIKVSVDPQSPVPLLARRLEIAVRQSTARGANRVVVLLDSEDPHCCPGERAGEISRALSRLTQDQFSVVLKHCKLENWLITSPTAIAACSGLFPDAESIRYPAGRADNADAYRLLSSATGRRSSYAKIRHADRLLQNAHVPEMQEHSRSFRKFVKEILG